MNQATEPLLPALQVAFHTRRYARAILVGCLALELAFVLLDYHVNYGRLTDIGAVRRLTNITREDGLASWFGTTQTLLVGLTAWVVLVLVRSQQAPAWQQAGWVTVAMTFTFMAIDDGAQVHERIGTAYSVFHERRGGSTFYPSYAWQVVLLPLFGSLGVIVAGFLWRELVRVRDQISLGLVVTAFAFFGFAIGLDFLEGLDRAHPWNLYARLAEQPAVDAFARLRFGQSAYASVQHFSRALEEFLEMLANTLLWAVFLRYLGSVAGEVRVQVT